MKCSIPGCDNELSLRSKLRTCATCRQSLHQLVKLRPAEVLHRRQRQIKFGARITTIATVVDGKIEMRPRVDLKDVMQFSRPKRKSNVVQFPKRSRRA